jgi:hypothetical protein
MFLADPHRIETEDRRFGKLFCACREKVAEISFVESFYRIMTLAGGLLKTGGNYCEKTKTVFFDVVMTTALQSTGLLEK